MTVKTITTHDGKTIIERYGDDRGDPPIKTRMQEIEEQTGLQIDRTLIVERSNQRNQPQQPEIEENANP